MIQDVLIKGMHCSSCERTLKEAFESLDGVRNATLSHEHGLARLETDAEIQDEVIKDVLERSGNYQLAGDEQSASERSKIRTFMPLILLGAYSLGVALLASDFSRPDWLMQLMRFFMGAVLLGFSFLKLLDLSGFADAFRSYDLIARRSRFYALAYPFIELALGLGYLFSDALILVNTATAIVMAIGSLGVYRALQSKRQIQCACVGSVFQLPMTKVTLTEDLLMLVMAVAMLLMA